MRAGALPANVRHARRRGLGPDRSRIIVCNPPGRDRGEGRMSGPVAFSNAPITVQFPFIFPRHRGFDPGWLRRQESEAAERAGVTHRARVDLAALSNVASKLRAERFAMPLCSPPWWLAPHRMGWIPRSILDGRAHRFPHDPRLRWGHLAGAECGAATARAQSWPGIKRASLGADEEDAMA